MRIRNVVVVSMSFSMLACTSTLVDGTGLPGTGNDSSQEQAPECTTDADCSFHDTDNDVCTKAVCTYGRCAEETIKDTAECQCAVDADCTYFQKQPCNSIACEAHKCVKNVVPAGPAPDQKAGDCSQDVCDGTSELPKKQYDEHDLGDTSNPCVVLSCDAQSGIQRKQVDNGTACGDGNVCFQGTCLACKPNNPDSCGGEGPGEPANDSMSTPAPYPQDVPFCAFSSGSDIDWYTFNAVDGDFTYDVYDFKVWSTAPTIEVCIYVKCSSGSPGGACSSKLAGPNGSLGCCWSGAPADVHPTWDLDCSGTGDDGGTTYVSVRTPGGDSCEPYAIVGGY
jgi:hypothetical protein